MIDRRLVTNFDWTLFVLVLLIAAIGVVNIYSATVFVQAGRHPVFPQAALLDTVRSFPLSLLVCSLDYHILEDFAYWLYGLVLVLLAAGAW